MKRLLALLLCFSLLLPALSFGEQDEEGTDEKTKTFHQAITPLR